MENYSFLADMLSTFRASPDWIKALSLICFAALAGGAAWLMAAAFVFVFFRLHRPQTSDWINDVDRLFVVLRTVDKSGQKLVVQAYRPHNNGKNDESHFSLESETRS
jgi:hypothetical protein